MQFCSLEFESFTTVVHTGVTLVIFSYEPEGKDKHTSKHWAKSIIRIVNDRAHRPLVINCGTTPSYSCQNSIVSKEVLCVKVIALSANNLIVHQSSTSGASHTRYRWAEAQMNQSSWNRSSIHIRHCSRPARFIRTCLGPTVSLECVCLLGRDLPTMYTWCGSKGDFIKNTLSLRGLLARSLKFESSYSFLTCSRNFRAPFPRFVRVNYAETIVMCLHKYTAPVKSLQKNSRCH